MNAEYLTVVGNTKPLVGIRLKRGSVPINLTTAGVESVELEIKQFKTGQIVNTGHMTTQIVTPETGDITYTPQATDFEEYGMYIGNAILHYADNGIEVLYDQLFIFARSR